MTRHQPEKQKTNQETTIKTLENLIIIINKSAEEAIKHIERISKENPNQRHKKLKQFTIQSILDLAADFERFEIGKMFGHGGNTYDDVFEIFSKRLREHMEPFESSVYEPKNSGVGIIGEGQPEDIRNDTKNKIQKVA